jgi:hypothetical protein
MTGASWKPGVVAFLVACSTACSDGCGNRVVQTVLAPGGRLRAVLFERNCGATTRFTTQVSVTSSIDAPSGIGNVFVADGGIAPTAWGGPWAEISWRSRDRLLIKYDRSARVFVRNARVAGGSVEFESVAPHH